MSNISEDGQTPDEGLCGGPMARVIKNTALSDERSRRDRGIPQVADAGGWPPRLAQDGEGRR